MRGVKIVARFFKSPENECFSLQLCSFAVRRCRRIPPFSTDRNPCVPAKPRKDEGVRRRTTRDLRFSKCRRKREKKRLLLSPFGKMAKKGRRPKSGGNVPRRFRSLRSPTLYRNKPYIPYYDRYRSYGDLPYKIKSFFKKVKKYSVFSPFSVIFTCIFITYIV